MSTIKRDRMAERIQAILSELLLREIADPRLKNLTITEVKLDAELMYADVYVNALADETRQDLVLSGLERAKGFLRREIGKRIRIRNTPELHFHWDVTLERGEHMHQLISKLNIPPAPPETADIVEVDADDTEHDELD
jgi:ribosome-binding factor A